MVNGIVLAPGVMLWREKFCRTEQKIFRDDLLARIETAPFYRPAMPGSGNPFSVEESNLGPLGWVSDKSGYRYQAMHPVTGSPWPGIPETLMSLWREIADAPDPECCLVNLYRGTAKMGLHQDKDEKAMSAPVVSVSLGDDALFPMAERREEDHAERETVVWRRGDVRRPGAPGLSRHRPHLSGSSSLIPDGGRINLTLRRVTA